jgi:hypothetical protein
VVEASGGELDGHSLFSVITLVTGGPAASSPPPSWGGWEGAVLDYGDKHPHRFIPVVAIPSISSRWKNRKNTKIGTSDSTLIANSPP